MSSRQFFSTSSIEDAGQRVAAWQDLMWRFSGRVRIEAAANVGFSGEVQYGGLGHAILSRISTGPHDAFHEACEPRDGRTGKLKLIFVLDGSVTIERAGQRRVIPAGSWTLTDTATSYSMSVGERVAMLALVVPNEILGFHQRDIARLGRRELSATTGAGRILQSMVECLFDEMEVMPPESAAVYLGLILDLAHSAVLESARSEAKCSVREMLHDRMSAFIRRHLRDPDLSVDLIATAFACSKRYVHKVFSSENRTVGETILASRLDRCRCALADPAFVDHSVTQIAFDWGFNNSAHFSRVFRERYGLAPTAYRALHAAEKSVA